MAISSPWSRAAVLQLIALGQTVHVVDFLPKESAEGEYLSVSDEFQKESIRTFRQQISGLHLINVVGSSSIKYIAAVPAFRSILRSVTPDIVLTLYGGGFAALAYLSLFRPYCVFVVGSDVLLASGLRKRLARLSLNSASCVFANGRYLAEKAQKLSDKVKVKPLLLGLDILKWNQSPQTLGTIRVVCSRGFLPVYNNEYIVHALALMPKELPDFEVVFVSNGPQLGQVIALADSMLPERIREKIHFLGGVDDDTLVNILENSHVYVSVSRSDGTSISLLEALSCGLYPVLSDIPQNREWINADLKNGSLVSLDKPEMLAEALSVAIRDANTRKRAAMINRQSIEKLADSRKNIALLLAEMENIHASRLS
ncbi:glycosyltransferase family 4 protein [Trichlorobacter ammonificans]|uniref:Glycosyl transferase family 1 domain-containing protein n=1 Tax=Trichlorobacter ammonificans TaxID=2916410 RepID=A0ABM9DD05_9BACT|nr:glycosyltransferase family 4 protein [Trichlorobacter ammonificans]CAH2032343.1 protein of unknown function [Trichlorobacter ammonificans]